MNDMSQVIIPKSDQWNADDFLAGPISITITKVEIRPGTEQPVSIFFLNDNGKPWKPCKSMARVLVHCWGPDANAYIGRSLQLYCDPKVTWGGMAVGGIRISNMTDIAEAHTMALTATKGSRKPFTVKPMARPETKPAIEQAPGLRDHAEAAAAQGVAAYQMFWKSITAAERKKLAPNHEALKATAIAADAPAPPPDQVDAFGLRPVRDEGFWAQEDLEVHAPLDGAPTQQWVDWEKRMLVLIAQARPNELEVLRSHNLIGRAQCLAAADPRIVAAIDQAFAAAEKRG